MNQQAGTKDIQSLEEQAARALQSGKEQEALKCWGRILEINPNHVRTLIAIGQHAFRQGNLASARVACQRVVDIDGSDAQQWINLALICQGLKDEAGEEAAIQQALTRDPSDLLALILRGNLRCTRLRSRQQRLAASVSTSGQSRR